MIHDKSRQFHDKPRDESNQLKVGDKVLLDEIDFRVATSEPNGAIPFTILNVFPYGTVEVTLSKFGTFKGPSSTSSSSAPAKIRHPYLRFQAGPHEDLYQLHRVRPLGLGHCIVWAALEQV
ncbi:hypothetical protein GOBAR_AA25321 [Gossypium barbadense]|uniref:Uncharacterized protein n=1 Tax=Gossypium barbadense TaxID=3634 RepID=A0A2P5WW89_GOSBA|nr:hypothetical protein GOBAR_AA25321 [Gossypium barbadense]